MLTAYMLSGGAMPTPQEEFDAVYITSTEIREYLQISRSTVLQGKGRGLLPDPITVNGAQIQIWRREQVKPFIEAWRLILQARRGELRA
jgi:hypothetical protein